jgi:hypothetical protein
MPPTQGAAQRQANWLGNNATTAPTGPLEARLCTSIPTATVAGTEATGGLYAPATIDFTDANANAEIFNTSVVRFEGLVPGTYVAVEIWDADDFRWHYIILATSRVITVSGDAIEFAAGELGTRVGF